MTCRIGARLTLHRGRRAGIGTACPASTGKPRYRRQAAQCREQCARLQCVDESRAGSSTRLAVGFGVAACRAKALSAGPASCCKPRCGAHGIRLPCHAVDVVGRNTPKGHPAIRGPGKIFGMTFPVRDPRCNALRVLHPHRYSWRCGSSYGNLAWAADASHAGNALAHASPDA